MPKRSYRKYRRRAKVSPTKELKARSVQTCFRRACDGQATLPMDSARLIVNNPPDCPYCHAAIPWQELSIDHVVPRSRGGLCNASNLVFTDKQCNMLKGNLTDTEFLLLLDFLNKHAKLKELLVPRLKAGGFMFRKRRR